MQEMSTPNNKSLGIIINEKSSSKLHFTPCRRIGLKRKSPGISHTSVESPKECDQTTTPNKNKLFPKLTSSEIDQDILNENNPKRKFLKFNKEFLIERTDFENDREVKENESNKIYTHEDLEGLDIKIRNLEKKIKDLNVNIPLKKHDISKLEELTNTWKNGCQKALNRLYNLVKFQRHSISMEELLKSLKIPPELVGYDFDLEEFV